MSVEIRSAMSKSSQFKNDMAEMMNMIMGVEAFRETVNVQNVDAGPTPDYANRNSGYATAGVEVDEQSRGPRA